MNERVRTCIQVICEMLCLLRLSEPVSRQTCFLAPYLPALYKYKNVIKNNIISTVLHIIVCLPKIE